MSQPRLFLHIDDTLLESRLLQLSALRKFMLVKSSNQTCWIEQLCRADCDAAILCLDHFSAMELSKLNDLKALHGTDFIVLSAGHPNPSLDALLLQKAGFHYRMPYSFEHIDTTLSDFYARGQQSRGSNQQALQSHLEQFGYLLGSSACMRNLYQTLRKVAQSDAHVLVIGESGAGKELVANTLHAASRRSDKPFVAINCGALSAELIDSELFGHVKGAFTGAIREHVGVFEQAEGGTLFLDEVTEMPLEQQVKLLRVLESGEYRKVGGQRLQHTNVRVVAATNRDPLKAIEEGVFREDLYFRLAQFPLQVPPLRDRGSDIEGLARHFLAYRNAQEDMAKSISAEAIACINDYSWPGNVRELKHALERAFILADDVIELSHLALQHVEADTATDIPACMPLKELEAAAIVRTLAANQGNKTSSAEQLGISVKTLYNKLEKYQQ
ncbi:MAG: sigma-54-dependent Fis family transcriptional regulator [Idiomarina sp.]|nr:sigma-54-dependent Fis family transcriptional regulator [Idiomarina sp.]